MKFKHISVLLNESIENLNIKEDGIYVDCTLGGAGHSREIIKKLSKKGRLIGIDQDMDAINAAKERLKGYSNVTFVHDNFYNIVDILKELNIEKVDGILMDLGVSSYQLDILHRGFSYMGDAPLDMRMNRDNDFSAYNVVNEYLKEDLLRILREYGEERFANRIADNIIKAREEKEIIRTSQLVEIIEKSIPMKFKKEGGHPAKKTFQAIRIEVNKELEILNDAILGGINHLNVGGRIVIITFHSLEDRIVKRIFKEEAIDCTCPKNFPICICDKVQSIKLISKKPILPSEEELSENSRSRSAKLRVAEKI